MAYHAAVAAGLGTLIFHFLLWRMLWRLTLAIWRIPTFGPIIVGLIVVGAIVLAVLRRRRGPGWPWRRRGGRFGYGTGTGPRDW